MASSIVVCLPRPTRAAHRNLVRRTKRPAEVPLLEGCDLNLHVAGLARERPSHGWDVNVDRHAVLPVFKSVGLRHLPGNAAAISPAAGPDLFGNGPLSSPLLVKTVR